MYCGCGLKLLSFPSWPTMHLHSTAINQRRKLYLILLTAANALIITSVYVAYNGLPHAIAPPSFTLRNPNTPFSEFLRLSTPHGGIAAPWTPLSLSRCRFGMPAHYAPCAAQNLTHVAYAEELLYPDFEIREPYFSKEEHRERWRKASSEITERGVLDAGWMAYRGQSGQNFVRSSNSTTIMMLTVDRFFKTSNTPGVPIISIRGRRSHACPA